MIILTFPCYVTLTAESEAEARAIVKSILEFGRTAETAKMIAPGEVVDRKLSWAIGRAMPGVFRREDKRPCGEPSHESKEVQCKT